MTQVKNRPPEQVMRLERLGVAFPTRLSFMRVLLRQLSAEGAKVTRPVFEINADGYGRAVYSVRLGGQTYSLVAFANPLAADDRTDRVIAAAWDATFVLYDGVPETSDLDRLEANAPLQEAGRFTARELVLCRANKSVRMFDHVVDRLAMGKQPERQMVLNVGYLMRTTAVYGNGKFGIADHGVIADRNGLSGPFAAEMLAVWLVRGFTLDLVEHVARARSPESFTPLAPGVKRDLGIGNATGLGMAPYLVSHPTLLNNWVEARETALARVLASAEASAAQQSRLGQLIARADAHLAQWNTEDNRQMQRVKVLRREWDDIGSKADAAWLAQPGLWQRLLDLAAPCSLECQEMMVALLLECNGPLVDDLEAQAASKSRGRFTPGMALSEFRNRIETQFDWAQTIDFSDPVQQQQFWYVSEEKQEPRLGDRYGEAGAELESPLDIGRRVQAVVADLDGFTGGQTVAEFLCDFPQHRYVARRVQLAEVHPYSELQNNLLADTCLPIDMLRCKLAFFGASKFDPKSDLWTRINMYQGAPLFEEITQPDADDWWLPVLEGTI